MGVGATFGLIGGQRDTTLLDLLLGPEPADARMLPPALLVPPDALGEMPALLARRPALLNEHGQYLDFDADLWRFRSSALYAGSAHALLAPDLRRPPPAIIDRLGLRRRFRAVSWHTHPATGSGSPWPRSSPSLDDLVTISLLPPGCRSRLHVVGAAGGIDAVVVCRPPAGSLPPVSWSPRHGRPPVRVHRRRLRWLQRTRAGWQRERAPAPTDPGFAAAYRRLLAAAVLGLGLACYHADEEPAPGRPLMLALVEPDAVPDWSAWIADEGNGRDG